MPDVGVIEICGAVGAAGASGSHSGQETTWSVLFKLEAWRDASGVIRRIPLRVSRSELSQADLSGCMTAFKGYGLIRLLIADLNLDLSGKWYTAKLVEYRGVVQADAELRSISIELQQPVTRNHEHFGLLTLDKRVDWFEGTRDWMGKAVSVQLSPDGSNSLDSSIEIGMRLWSDQDRWNGLVRALVLKELLPLKNDSWLGEGEEEIESSQFLERMALTSISVHPSGEVEFWHDDGDLFWGHSILVSGTIVDGPTHTAIPG